MKVTDIKDVNRFFEIIDQCEGKVELVTKYGDCLNLAPKISQCVATVKIITDSEIQQGDIVLHNKEDKEKIMQVMNNS